MDSYFKHKYDVGKLWTAKYFLKQYLLITLKTYPESVKQKNEISSQIQDSLNSGVIKESNNLYSTPVALVIKGVVVATGI